MLIQIKRPESSISKDKLHNKHLTLDDSQLLAKFLQIHFSIRNSGAAKTRKIKRVYLEYIEPYLWWRLALAPRN